MMNKSPEMKAGMKTGLLRLRSSASPMSTCFATRGIISELSGYNEAMDSAAWVASSRKNIFTDRANLIGTHCLADIYL